MAKTIKDRYDDNPAAGDDETKNWLFPSDDNLNNPATLDKTQVSNAVATVGAVKEIADRVGVLETGTTLQLDTFTATVDVDTIIADLVWAYSGSTAPVEWIVKEDDTSLPAVGDADWETAEFITFTLSDNNQHTLTARVKDGFDNISNAITVTVTPPVSATHPVITSVSVVNPAAGATAFTYSIDATGDASDLASYIIQYGDASQPALGDAGWVSSGGNFPLSVSGIAGNLPALEDTTVTFFVKSPTDVSAGVSAFVNTSVLGGETAPNGDFLWINNPTTAGTYTGARTFTGTGALVIDGTDTGTYGGAEVTTTGDNNPSISITGAYSSVEIINLNFLESNGGHIFISGVNSADITIRNCKFGISNSNNSAVNLFKSAISLNNCNATAGNPTAIDILGNWFDGPDGCIIMEDCDSSGSDHIVIRVKHNFVSKMIRHNATDSSLFVTNFFTGRFGSVYGEISNNIYYEPTGQYYAQDLLNLATTYGVDANNPFEVTRNRFWAPSLDQASNAAVQLGDKSNNRYNKVHENTFIDINTFGQFSSGNNHEFSNNKGYTSEAFPAVFNGYIYQIQRQGVDPGLMYSDIYQDNTYLHYYDDGSGNLIQRGVYYPSYGRDNSGVAAEPNHGTLAQGNVPPTGLSTNENSHSEWANGVGKSELWRESWKTFSYGGADGNTPTINYDSPWVGDGGSQGFTAASITSTAFGDGAEINSIQTHDVLSLVSGGTSPFIIDDLTGQVNCTATRNADSSAVIFTAGGTGGSFSYNYTALDQFLQFATGTISGTVVDPAGSTAYRMDQNSTAYISISFEPLTSGDSWHEIYTRGGAEWLKRTGGGSPDGDYLQQSPYSGTVASGDVETTAEVEYNLYFDTNGTYTVYVAGMALGSSNYDSVWAGFNDTVHTLPFVVSPADSAYHWCTVSTPLTITISSAPETHTFHLWKNKGGFAAGKVLITSGSAPTTLPEVAQSPEILV